MTGLKEETSGRPSAKQKKVITQTNRFEEFFSA
jgi:hypothetical protein